MGSVTWGKCSVLYYNNYTQNYWSCTLLFVIRAPVLSKGQPAFVCRKTYQC